MTQPTAKHCLILASLFATLIATLVAQPVQAIVGGQDAKLGEFPFLVALVDANDGTQFCGGSIINEQWVLTAAHCFFSNDEPPVQDTFAQDVQVKAGIISLSDSHAQMVGVTHIYQPGYDGTIHDIALLHVDSPLALDNKTVASIMLNANAKFPQMGTKVIVAGWGATDIEGQIFPDILKKVAIPVIGCDSDVQGEYVCTGDKKGNDTCSGDSGGPLVVQQTAELTSKQSSNAFLPGIRAIQIGFVSFGGEKCSLGSAFTRTSAYIDWINKTIADNTK